jgi:tRNA threonylcarbamoyladenosine biosynthesis protein TsaB
MIVLAIDTALEACSVAVFDAARSRTIARESFPMVRGHAEALMPIVARVMDQADIEFSDLDRIAVTTGPGSFTGLRVGVAAARGLALAASKPAIGITTLTAFAAAHIAQDDSSPVVAVIDARHDHVYLQMFGTGGRSILAPRIVAIQDAVHAALGTGVPVRLVGSAAHLLATAWPVDAPRPLAVDARVAPDIDWVARLGAAANDRGETPKPLYLRAPDAQPQDASRLPRR